ncbi:UDP-forming cellulose synthase catalytic subunit [Halomonas sp. GXIMD04776]|uniref:UDP-forming cellulose synthase catalytic subunit n=1 Tax=Halomonas sp. GXIMD04776 TaxID=3415605 RepID=UPI003CB77EC4
MSFWLHPGAGDRWKHHYRHLRDERGATPLTAATLTLAWVIAWCLLPLESKRWQRLLSTHSGSFAHLQQRRPGIADPLRYGLQLVWLMLVRPRRSADTPRHERFKPVSRAREALHSWARKVAQPISGHLRPTLRNLDPVDRASSTTQNTPWLLVLMGGTTAILMLLVITQPFTLPAQALFSVLLWIMALIVRRLPGRFSTLILIVLSLTVSCRYLWWRYTSTLNWDDALDMTFGLLLLGAETYSWLVLVLGYFQTLWPLNRKPVALPEDTHEWPSVDLMIPTYNESLEVVRPTVLAALGLDWPKDKLNIYLLDDGKRSSFRDFAAEVGIGYITRNDNNHAKAGNLNHALTLTQGDYIAIFDCDHVPQRSFLQMTMGWFLKDPRLGLVQTPHHFFSPDPFERNLDRFRRMPNEGTLFYGLVQDGNDLWDAAFFCGSCAVLKRRAIEAIGGFAVETVTEDAHTSLRLHRKGFTSAYLRIPQAAGLATESVSAHIGQRIRWARGMVQIFRLDNPLFGPGLRLSQRLCYVNAMLHFLAGVPRLIFLTAPLAFLLLHAYIIYAPAFLLLAFVIPHMLHSGLTNSHVQGRYRHSFWSEVYDTVLAWYIALPTTVALINPRKGKFNVTAKGGLVDKQYFDWGISRPYLLLILLNLSGVVAAAWRLQNGPADEIPTVLVSLVWVFYNLVILGGAIAVAAEARQVRRNHRVRVTLPAAVQLPGGYAYPCTLQDYAEGGLGIYLPAADLVKVGDTLTLLLRRGQQEHAFTVRVVNASGERAGLELEKMSLAQHIDYIQCTFARADTWSLWRDDLPQDRPMKSMVDVICLGFEGYRRLFQHAPRGVRAPVSWLGSFIPQRPREATGSSSI